MKLLDITKNNRKFLNGWWVVVDVRTRLNLAFFKMKVDAIKFKKLKGGELNG